MTAPRPMCVSCHRPLALCQLAPCAAAQDGRRVTARPISPDMIFDVFLDGLLTGLTTAFEMYNDDEAAARRAAQDLVDMTLRDPIATEQLREQVINRLRGDIRTDLPPITVYTADGGQ